MRPCRPGSRIIQVERQMQTLELRGNATLRSHDAGMRREQARDAAGSSIGKHLAHDAIVSLGRGSTINARLILAIERKVHVTSGGAAPPATR